MIQCFQTLKYLDFIIILLHRNSERRAIIFFFWYYTKKAKEIYYNIGTLLFFQSLRYIESSGNKVTAGTYHIIL